MPIVTWQSPGGCAPCTGWRRPTAPAHVLSQSHLQKSHLLVAVEYLKGFWDCDAVDDARGLDEGGIPCSGQADLGVGVGMMIIKNDQMNKYDHFNDDQFTSTFDGTLGEVRMLHRTWKSSWWSIPWWSWYREGIQSGDISEHEVRIKMIGSPGRNPSGRGRHYRSCEAPQKTRWSLGVRSYPPHLGSPSSW